ncbi:MAG: AAA family ATPase [Candidatus Thiodiazotropha sp. (ex Lucinoma borealis)]|nr:AAA family ATPase [Candidatus Thiodiazotropha sp. (ex Lucinoma borealis)]MCU7864474.1 AAA family ATPase [Candidatus Thiodiazotropha sp. (ex Lucinoma borealis)]
MFKPDRPIEATKEDLLGRAEFSRSFGQAILAYNEKDSIVTALYGDWGSGKSSVINMSLEYIEEQAKQKEKDEKPIIVKFNPWNYSDQSHLIALFFKELSFALRREDYGKEASDIGEKLEAYSNFFTPLAMIPDPTVITISVLMQRLFGGVGKAAKAWGAAYSKDLDATRKELNTLLGEQKRKIVIVVDDIDRLNNDEIRQIFQLVKMLGDFPNTIYVLAFDRGVVVKALAKVQEGPGDDYLEKIVQFPVELPPISRSDLEKLLFTLLDELIKEIPEEKWDATYWGNIYHSGMRHYFKTIRDVTRYINTLKFSFEMVRDDVNPVDFIAITTLQVFEPDLYSGIRDNKDLFAGILGDSYRSGDAEKKQALARCDELLARAQYLEKEQLTDFLGRLFPKLESIYGNMGYGYDWMESWRRESRICHPELFDIYFLLALPPGEIPKNEITSVLDLASDQEAFSEALSRLKDDGRIIRYLELMEDYTKDYIKVENIQNIVSVLMDIGDSFPEGKTGGFDFDTPMRILRVFRQLSMRYDTQDERFNIFKQAIEEAENSIYTIVHKVGVLGQEHGRLTSKSEEQIKPEEEREMNVEQLDELEKLAAEKITKWSDEGKLNKHPNLASILYSWQRWDSENPDVSKQFVQNLIGTDEGLIDFITVFAGQSTSQTMGDYVSRKNWRINLKNLGDFVSVKVIEPRMRKIHSSSGLNNLSDNQQKAIQVFLDTFDGKVEDW